MPELPSRFRVVRHEDLLVVDIELVNLALSDDGLRLQRVDAGAPARLVVHLPSQHVAEQAFPEVEGPQLAAGPPPVKALAAGPTRLAFNVPDDVTDLPLSVETLLAWDRLEPHLAPNALPASATDGPRPGVPAADETAVEFPYRLLLSPDAGARWVHRSQPFSAGPRTELWHTRLDGDDVAVRAVGRRPPGDSFTHSLVDRDLDDIVTLSADFGVQPKSAEELGLDPLVWRRRLKSAGLADWFGVFHYQPKPLRAERLLLTALGASARLRGVWDYPAPEHDRATLVAFGMPAPSLEQYEHTAGSGRDQFVRIVRRGFVCTGHRASLIKITERSFEPKLLTPERVPAVFGATAYLRQYYQVVIQEPELAYGPLSGGYDHGGREMLIRSLRFTTLVTPKIDLKPSPAEIEQGVRAKWRTTHIDPRRDDLLLLEAIQSEIEDQFKKPFWVNVNLAPFEFGVVATDWEGRHASFSMPLVFVPYEAVSDDPGAVLREFLKGTTTNRTRSLGNQSLALADPAGSKPGSTRLPVESITFGLQAVPAGRIRALPKTYRPRWVLTIVGARVHIDAVERLTGSTAAVPVRLAGAYLNQEANTAGVFAELTGGPIPVAFPAERGGGLGRPDTSVSLLSSRQGALPAAFAKPMVAKEDLDVIFGTARLFGSVPLARLLAPVTPTPGDFDHADLSEDDLRDLLAHPRPFLPVPVLRTRPLPGPNGDVPTATESRFVWKPALALNPTVGALSFTFDKDRAALVLDARLVTPLDGGEATSEFRSELRHFTMTFAGVVAVEIDRLAFAALPGRKPDLTAKGFRLTFKGALEFVSTLVDLLPGDGFSDPPAVSATPSGISAGYSLAVPSFGIGVFSLQNLSLSAALAIAFNDQPASIRFAVSERHHPFTVTVAMFGGGGFLALGISAKGVESVEAAIEFGGNISLNLGVASGGVSVMAGIYFGLTGSQTTLTGYFRCGGYLSVLGLVSLSVEFYLAFNHRPKDGGKSEAWGQARVTVSVKVALFSTSVSLSVEKRFAGAAGDPTFDQVVEPDDWEQYCLAFAP